MLPAPTRNSGRHALPLALAILVASVPSALAPGAEAGGVTAQYTTSESKAGSVELEYVGEFLGGSRYVTTLQVGSLEVTWDYTVKIDSAGKRLLNGETKVVNESFQLVEFLSSASTTLCPAIVDQALVGGIVTVILVTNSDGGCLLCSAPWPPEDGFSRADFRRVDGSTWSRASFLCPIELCFTGGQGGTGETWGVSPLPSMTGPVSVSSIAHSVNVALTGGELVAVSALLAASGILQPEVDPTCPADVSGDGLVDGADLARLLSAWGVAGCQALEDVNVDGSVDGGDLALVLSAWGECATAP